LETILPRCIEDDATPIKADIVLLQREYLSTSSCNL